MKKEILLSLAVILLTATVATFGQVPVKEAKSGANAVVAAYYFHNTARCVTCKAVEAEAKADLESLYGNKVVFRSLDLEDPAAGDLVKKLEISGQTLLIVKGDKKVNLTNEGFLYARSNPEKFKSILKENVDNLLK